MADYYGTFEAIAFENGGQDGRGIFGSEVLVGVDAQLKNETHTAAETARSFYQQTALAAHHAERDVALGQQVAQIGGSFHAPWQGAQARNGLPDVEIQSRHGPHR